MREQKAQQPPRRLLSFISLTSDHEILHRLPARSAEGPLTKLLVRSCIPRLRSSKFRAEPTRGARGLKFVARDRRTRLLAIAEWLAHSSTPTVRRSGTSYHSEEDLAVESSVGYDIVALQEIWCQEDYRMLSSRAKDAGLIYSRYFYS